MKPPRPLQPGPPLVQSSTGAVDGLISASTNQKKSWREPSLSSVTST